MLVQTMNNNFTGRVAIVTGSSRGIGRAIAETLASGGAQVVVNYAKDSEGAEKTVDTIVSNGNTASVFQADVSVLSQSEDLINYTLDKHGNLDILVNNAGTTRDQLIMRMSEEDWENGINGTINGVFRCTREVIPIMEKNGEGNIINISSMYGKVSPDPSIYEDSLLNSLPNYGAGKAAVIQYPRFLACHLAKKRIRVNSVSPGPFPQEEVQQNIEFINRLKKKIPMGRIGLPHELKGVIVFLASDASSFITGENILVDGGWTAW